MVLGLRIIPALAILFGFGCGGEPRASDRAGGAAAEKGVERAPDAGEAAFLDDVQERTFRFFWDLSDPRTGLTPDRFPTKSFASISATGFALTAYPIGIERGWVERDAALERVLATLRFFQGAKQDTSASGATGWKGFFYHFLDSTTGLRFREVELSTVDTALLFAGALFCQSYFDGSDPREAEIRALTDTLCARADWKWASPRAPAIGHGWSPEGGHLEWDWRGYNEAMLVYVLALGSPARAVDESAWAEWCSTYQWGTFHGQEHFGFAPLFGHQYTHVWVDFHGIQDASMRERGIDYFENSRRATIAQREYAIENPGGWSGYGPNTWGLSACDGPVERELEIAGKRRAFHTYWARGASFTTVQDDGTLCPSAMGASIAFAPEIVIPALRAIREEGGERVYGVYGYLDAFNPTFTLDVPVQHGLVDSTRGWVDTDWLGIDQGPLLAMIENHRTGLVWKHMRKNAHVLHGLRRAGFTGGWLDSVETSP